MRVLRSMSCIVLCAMLVALSACESSDDGDASASSLLPGSWSWSSAKISAPQFDSAVMVTPALLASVNKTITLDATVTEPDSFSATAVVPDLSDLAPIVAGFGFTLPESVMALQGTYDINGTWDASAITVTVPLGTFVIPYSVSGNALTLFIPQALIQQIAGSSDVAVELTMARN